MAKFLSFILAIMIPLVVILTQWQSTKYKEFLKTAKEVDGQITLAEHQVFDRKNNRKEYIIAYEFEVDGARYEGQDRLEYADMEDQFSLGSRTLVLYDPAHPRTSYIKLLLLRRIGVSERMPYGS